MKTATLEDLETRLPTILDWVKSGEDVIVKGASPTHPTKPVLPKARVDLSKSSVYRDRTGDPVLSQEDLDALSDHMRGPY